MSKLLIPGAAYFVDMCAGDDVRIFFYTIFVSSHMYPENPERTQVIVGSMNMGYISDTARNRIHNLFRPKCAKDLVKNASRDKELKRIAGQLPTMTARQLLIHSKAVEFGNLFSGS